MPKRPGFSLVELVVALTLSSFVLVGIVGVASQMVRFQIETSNTGTVTGWTLLTLNQMNRELQDASVLNSVSATSLSGCGDFSKVNNQPLDGVNANITAFYYCVAAVGGFTSLLRYGASGACPYAPTCGSSGYSLVAQNVSQIGATPYFQRDDTVGGVSLNFNVGNTVATTNRPNPVFIKVSTTIRMNKAYDNATD